jgi:hypothetical protein
MMLSRMKSGYSFSVWTFNDGIKVIAKPTDRQPAIAAA